MTQDQNQTTWADPQSSATPTPTNPFPPAVANLVPAENLTVPSAQVSPETELALVPELSTELAAVPAPDLSAEIVTAEPVTMAVNADSAAEPAFEVAPAPEPAPIFASLPTEAAPIADPAQAPASTPAEPVTLQTPASSTIMTATETIPAVASEPIAAPVEAAPAEESDAAPTLNEPVDFATQKQQLEAEIAESKAQLETLDKFEKAIFAAEEDIHREKEAAQIAALEAEFAA